jgi:hypothetical protein
VKKQWKKFAKKFPKEYDLLFDTIRELVYIVERDKGKSPATDAWIGMVRKMGEDMGAFGKTMKVAYFNACEKPEMEVERIVRKEPSEVLDMVRALAEQVLWQYEGVTISFEIKDNEKTCIAWMEVQE